MKRFLTLVVLLLLAITLSSCDSIEYEETIDNLNGYKIYSYESNQEICSPILSTSIDVGDGYFFELVNNCSISYFIYIEGDYVSLEEYLENNVVDVSELADLHFGILTDSSRIIEVLEIDLNNIFHYSVFVLEIDNEPITPDAVIWNTIESLDVPFELMINDLTDILNEPLGEVEQLRLCESCNEPINIYLFIGGRDVLIKIYETHIHINVSQNNETIYNIYDIKDPSGAINSLYNNLYSFYLEVNSGE